MPGTNPDIDALYVAFYDAFRRGDVDAILSLVTADYVLWAPGAPPMTVDELRPRLAAALAAFEVEPQFERDEQLVSGDLAVERGWDVQTVRPRGGGEGRTNRQRVFVILRKGADGRWRFARGISQPGPA